MPLPHGSPISLRRLLLPPIQTDVVTASKDDIETPVPVEIFDYERTTRMRQRGFAVKFPWPCERVARRPLVPADFTEHVFTPVAVDVAERIPMPAAFRAEDEGPQHRRAVPALGEAPNFERIVFPVTRRIQLRRAVIIEVMQREHFHVAAGFGQQTRLPW